MSLHNFSFSNPKDIISNWPIYNGHIVADFGAGTGHYSSYLSKKVGDNGRVYAIDIQKDLLSRLNSEIKQKNINNVDIVWGDIELLGGTKLKAESVNHVVVANVLFLVEKKENLAKEASRILKPDGLLFLVDWSESFGGVGPSLGQVVRVQDAREIFESNGFTLQGDFSAGAHHYGIIFKKTRN